MSRVTSKDVKRLINTIEGHGYKTHWTCCTPEHENRWWVSVGSDDSRCEVIGNTREVYQWLKGVLSGLYIAG